jgi:hypothetical protein
MPGDCCKVIRYPPLLWFGYAAPLMEWIGREGLLLPLETTFQLVLGCEGEVENEEICCVLACLEPGLRKTEWLPVVWDEPRRRKHAPISREWLPLTFCDSSRKKASHEAMHCLYRCLKYSLFISPKASLCLVASAEAIDLHSCGRVSWMDLAKRVIFQTLITLNAFFRRRMLVQSEAHLLLKCP